jgi:CheY-like chemotaxis protein
MSVSILIVDDEPDVADLFRQHFRREARQGTYVLHFAGSGAALERLAGGSSRNSSSFCPTSTCREWTGWRCWARSRNVSPICQS